MKMKLYQMAACVLCALLMIALMPASALSEENADAGMLPTLYITADYGKSTKDGRITGSFLLKCRYPENPSGSAHGAPGTVITIEGENGIVPEDGNAFVIHAGDLACGEEFRFDLNLRLDETLATERNTEGRIEPRLTINAYSSSIGGCDYTCIFDITPEVRAHLVGVNTSQYLLDAYLMHESMSAFEDKISSLYYDTHPVETFVTMIDISDPNAKGVEEALAPVSDTDDNDVTYVYINAFSAENGFQSLENGEKTSVSYDEFIGWIAGSAKGRVIVLMDTENGYLAADSANRAGADGEFVNVLGVRVPRPSDYDPAHGLSTQGALARSAEMLLGTIDIAQLSGMCESRENPVNAYLSLADGKRMAADYSGKGENLFASSDENYDSGVRILAVKDEMCEVNPADLDALRLYYDYLKRLEAQGYGLASDSAIEVEPKKDDSHWEKIGLDGGNGFVSAVVCDLDLNGTQDMLAVYTTYDYANPDAYDGDGYYNESPEHFCMELRLYQIDKGTVYLADTKKHAMYFDNFQLDSFGRGYVYMQKADGFINIFCDSWFVASNSHNGSHGGTYYVKDGKILDADHPARFEHTWTERAQKLHQYTVWEGLSSLGKGETFIECVRNDMPYWICATYYSDEANPVFKNGGTYYRAWDFTNLRQILSGESEAEYYEVFTLPDYVKPPENTRTERYIELISGLLTDVFPAGDVTVTYRNDAHTSANIRLSNTVHVQVDCYDDGMPKKIDLRSFEGTSEWRLLFSEFFRRLLSLSETGASESSRNYFSDLNLKTYEIYYSPDQSVRVQFTYQPMHEDYAILMAYFE